MNTVVDTFQGFRLEGVHCIIDSIDDLYSKKLAYGILSMWTTVQEVCIK